MPNAQSKRRIDFDLFVESILPTIQITDAASAKQAIIDHLNAKAIEVVDEEGNPVDIDGTLILQVAGAAPEENMEDDEEVKADDDEDDDDKQDDDDDDEAKAAMAKAIADAVARRLAATTKSRKARPSPPRPDAKGQIILPGNVRRGRVKNFRGKIRHPGTGQELDPELRAYRFGKWCLANVAKSIHAFADEFPAARKYCEEHGLRHKLHETATNTAGGYMVPEEFGTDLIDLREQYGVARQVLKIRPMSSDTRTDPRRAGGLTAHFVGEGSAGTESTKKWDQIRLIAKDLMVLSRYTAQLSEDAVINIGDDLAGEIAYAFSEKEDSCAFKGDGTSTYGGITGIPQRLEDINGVDDGGGIVLGANNEWSGLTLANFNKVVGILPQYADSQNVVWVCHRTFYYSVMEKLLLAAGGTPATEIREGQRQPRPLFQVYPVVFLQIMPSSEENSQIPVLFGDFSLAASFGDRSQDSIMFSEHATVDGESVFERNQIAIRGTERFDINVHDVGTATAAGPVVGLITAAS